MDDLYALVYVSIAARALSLGDLGRLLESARRRNQEEGITGVLLYSDGMFMQCLEGPAAGLVRVYDVIRADPLHYGLIEIVRAPVACREFPEWSMAFRLIGAPSSEPPDAALAQRLGGSDIPVSPARSMLASFWQFGRGAMTGQGRPPSPAASPLTKARPGG